MYWIRRRRSRSRALGSGFRTLPSRETFRSNCDSARRCIEPVLSCQHRILRRLRGTAVAGFRDSRSIALHVHHKTHRDHEPPISTARTAPFGHALDDAEIADEYLSSTDAANHATVHLDGIGRSQRACVYPGFTARFEGAADRSVSVPRWLSVDASQDLTPTW